MPQHEIVDTVSACRAAVANLNREEFVAADTEGVNLSKIGSMTLVQIATASGHVFLFDVMREPRMFKDGGLKRFLEKGPVVKVLHSAKNDAEALLAQHGVTLLENVHDTQIAHMEILRKDGAKFPSRPKLEEVCEIYCPEKLALVKAEKDDIQIKWKKTEGEYWTKRPLTWEMIEYATNDVIALIPEIYLAQKQLLADKGLTTLFKTSIENDIKRTCDSRVNDKLQKEEKELIHSILYEFAAIVTRRTKYADITDDNVLKAFSRLRLDDHAALDLSPLFLDLKLQQLKTKLDKIEDEMRLKGDAFQPTDGICGALQFFSHLKEDAEISKQAERLLKQVDRIILEDIGNKYTTSTPVRHICWFEKTFLSRRIRPEGTHDPSFHKVVLRLHWAVREEELEESIGRFRADPANFKVSQGYAKLLHFYRLGDVPSTLQAKANDFLSDLARAGKDCNTRRR
ncbi:uncharacterized protein [Littorina saxatilis]|uniref:3'-5' exonuclease domain-containing protein n=1 Tax=Littorina saxatilis TaxID=31220 RepID=A0AAN9G3E1_9CAEN